MTPEIARGLQLKEAVTSGDSHPHGKTGRKYTQISGRGPRAVVGGELTASFLLILSQSEKNPL